MTSILEQAWERRDEIAARVRVGQVWANQSGDRVFRVIGERQQRTYFSEDDDGNVEPFTLDSFPVESMPTPRDYPESVGVMCFAFYRLMKDVPEGRCAGCAWSAGELATVQNELEHVSSERDRLASIVEHIAGLTTPDEFGYHKVHKTLVRLAREAVSGTETRNSHTTEVDSPGVASVPPESSHDSEAGDVA